MPDSGIFNLIVDRNEEGERLDVLVANHLVDCSRSNAGILIRNKNITVHGNIKKPSYRVKAGDKICGEIPPPEKISLTPESIDIQIIYEDPHIIVLNKQPGIVVHPAPGHYSGTLVNALLHHCPEIGPLNGELRPGIVHRLDKDTSGTMVVAKTSAAHQDISNQFKNRDVKKIYFALVLGRMKSVSGKIELPIGRHPVHRKKMSVIAPTSREAETLWWVEKEFKWATLLNLRLNTGRTHQIRVHCKAIHHPIVGDPLYGGTKPSKETPKPVLKILNRASRQMLHAYSLELTHPNSRERKVFTSPLPEDMNEMIQQLENEAL